MIKIENIGKVFNPHSRNRNQVLKDVTFELPEKGLICIYGKSGSGKTTLLNIIGGLDKQDGGKIIFDGEDVKGNVDRIRNQRTGFIFQNYYLEKGYTIAEIMRNAMVIAGFKDEEEIEKRSKEVLDLVDMERFRNKQGDALSGGQKQRVAIARALIKGADVILADEPTGNLDAENTMKVMDILKEISRTKLVVVVTHEVTLIKKYADSYIQLVDGKLTDKDAIGEVFKYETEKNNIYVDEKEGEEISQGDVNFKVYGKPRIKAEDIQIYEDKGRIFLSAGKNVTIIDDKSEKKIIFKGSSEETSEPIEKKVPKFEKSTSKKNGRLFSLRNIFKAQRNTSDERVYSTANIFKQVFISVIAVVMCFLSLMGFEVLRVNTENKALDDNSVYVNINTYNELRNLSEDTYEDVDFFETAMKDGTFSYNDLTALSGIKEKYTPRAIRSTDTEESLKLVSGEMPQADEALVTRGLAERLKKNFRISELNTDRAIPLVIFENQYDITGIVEGDSPEVYLNKQDYINFLGVYNTIQFVDVGHIFFEEDYTNSTYSSEIIALDEGLSHNETYVELSRNALYKMMPDIVDADFKVQKANSVLRKYAGVTGLEIASSNLYVRKLSITRDAIKTDLRIYVSKEALENIFVELEPNLNSVNGGTLANGIPSEHYFEIVTNGGDQLLMLKQRLSERGITPVNISSRYEMANSDAIRSATNKLTIFFVVIILLLLVYFFMEKSGSIKNSREYGIYRAIGVNRSNLLYKEGVLAVSNNMLSYAISYLVVAVIMCIRYGIMNIATGAFIGMLLGVFFVSALVMLGISLIPYLFVLFKTPSEILSRYDI